MVERERERERDREREREKEREVVEKRINDQNYIPILRPSSG